MTYQNSYNSSKYNASGNSHMKISSIYLHALSFYRSEVPGLLPVDFFP